MIKFLKYFSYTIIGLVLALNLVILVSGKWYVYKVLEYTIFKFKLGPDIHEYTKDPLSIIEKGNSYTIPFHRNYNQQKLNRWFYDLKDSLGTVSYLVIKNDSLLYEEYFDGYTHDSLSNSFSMAKSIVGLLIGVAQQEGKLNIEDYIQKYIPDFDEKNKNKVKIVDLLTMSSGINFSESYLNPFGFAAEALYGSNLKKLIYKYELKEAPGKNFSYQSGNTQLLCMILEKATGKKIAEYASEKLWKKIGAEKNAKWSLDSENGLARAFCCFNSNAADFAKLGMLMLNYGKFKNVQVVDSSYIVKSITPAKIMADGKPNDKYGYQWWICQYKNENIFYARGILGQYIICIPSKNMVVVRLGHKRSQHKINDHPIDFYKYIDAALEISEKP
jgi:CubicO group peptidase (beta-lactamase class C family)